MILIVKLCLILGFLYLNIDIFIHQVFRLAVLLVENVETTSADILNPILNLTFLVS